jgi:hypothetical protein
MGKIAKTFGVGLGLTLTAGVVAYEKDYLKIVTEEEGYSYANGDASWTSFSIGGLNFFFSPQPFTDEDMLDSEGYPLHESADTSSYVPDTDIPQDVAERIAETIPQRGIVCPDQALTIDYKPENETDNSQSTESTLGSVPLRICIDYPHTRVDEENELLVVPLTIESRTGVPALDLSFKSENAFCQQIVDVYARQINDDLHDTSELRIMLDESNFNFSVVMSASGVSPCDSQNLQGVQHEER